jgi:hypothetical protein
MLYFSIFYYKIVVKYIKQSLQPIQLFGVNVEKSLDEFIKNPEKSHSIIESLEEIKSGEILKEERNKTTKG